MPLYSWPPKPGDTVKAAFDLFGFLSPVDKSGGPMRAGDTFIAFDVIRDEVLYIPAMGGAPTYRVNIINLVPGDVHVPTAAGQKVRIVHNLCDAHHETENRLLRAGDCITVRRIERRLGLRSSNMPWTETNSAPCIAYTTALHSTNWIPLVDTEAVTDESVKTDKCTCPTHVLMTAGCKCGNITPYQLTF